MSASFDITLEPVDIMAKTDNLQGALDPRAQDPRRGPSHGFAVTAYIHQHSDDVLLVQAGSLYPALHRMTEVGLLRAEADVRGRPACEVLRADGQGAPNARGRRRNGAPFRTRSPRSWDRMNGDASVWSRSKHGRPETSPRGDPGRTSSTLSSAVPPASLIPGIRAALKRADPGLPAVEFERSSNLVARRCSPGGSPAVTRRICRLRTTRRRWDFYAVISLE